MEGKGKLYLSIPPSEIGIRFYKNLNFKVEILIKNEKMKK